MLEVEKQGHCYLLTRGRHPLGVEQPLIFSRKREMPKITKNGSQCQLVLVKFMLNRP